MLFTDTGKKIAVAFIIRVMYVCPDTMMMMNTGLRPFGNRIGGVKSLSGSLCLSQTMRKNTYVDFLGNTKSEETSVPPSAAHLLSVH